jgi:signal transduction histidine kinase
VAVPAIPGALQRCLTNLIDNAVKYGGYARVTAGCEAGNVVIRVADGGPGIPEAQMERVFDPFYRLETSRSRETGGSGLGLTIARNISHKHGGTLTLRNKPGGGLECLLVLPIQR